MARRTVHIEPTPAEFVAEFGPQNAIERAQWALDASVEADAKHPLVEGNACHAGVHRYGINAGSPAWKTRHCACFGPTETARRTTFLAEVKATVSAI